MRSPEISTKISYLLTRLFILEKTEHTLVQITYTFSHGFHGLEISYITYHLLTLDFLKEFFILIFLNVKIHTTDLVNKRNSYQTKRNINVYHFGTFKKNLCNFGYIWRITLYSFFKYQNEKKQISNFNQIWKLAVSKWFVFKTYCLRYALKCALNFFWEKPG